MTVRYDTIGEGSEGGEKSEAEAGGEGKKGEGGEEGEGIRKNGRIGSTRETEKDRVKTHGCQRLGARSNRIMERLGEEARAYSASS